MNNQFSIRSGTISGALTVVFCNIPGEELIRIALSAAIGTTVSFLISVLLKGLVKKQNQQDRS
jgi:mannitol-specific phosphotransferase system IIBC component